MLRQRLAASGCHPCPANVAMVAPIRIMAIVAQRPMLTNWASDAEELINR